MSTESSLRMLATDVVFTLVRGGSTSLEARLVALPAEGLCISAMTRAELALVQSALKDHQAALRVRELMKIVRTLAWDAVAADEYAALLTRMAQEDVEVGRKDVAVAAHAIAMGAVLATVAPATFNRIAPGMALEDWS